MKKKYKVRINQLPPEPPEQRKEKERKKMREWMRQDAMNPDSNSRPRILLQNAINRAKKFGVFIQRDEEDLKKQFEIYKEVNQLNILHGKRSFHVDHILPLHLGGRHASDNLQILSAADNLRKSHMERFLDPFMLHQLTERDDE